MLSGSCSERLSVRSWESPVGEWPCPLSSRQLKGNPLSNTGRADRAQGMRSRKRSSSLLSRLAKASISASVIGLSLGEGVTTS